MKNRKGQTMGQVGVLIMFFITVLVGVVLLAPAAQNIGDVINTIDIENESLVTAASNGAEIYLDTWKVIGSPLIFNATGDTPVDADNYTITNNALNPTTGAESVLITVSSISGANSGVWTIDGVGQTPSYAAESSTRAISTLILTLFALAILVVAVSFAVGTERMKDFMGI